MELYEVLQGYESGIFKLRNCKRYLLYHVENNDTNTEKQSYSLPLS